MTELPYREGDAFAIPFRNGGFSLGIVARSSKQGHVLLGYFFGEKFPSVPAPADLPTLLPGNALRVMKFGDLSLMSGEWPVVGRLQNWHRDDWPMPKFIRRDPLGRRVRLVSYADDDPNRLVVEEPADSEASAHEEDRLLGAGLVELLLTQLLEPRAGG